MRLCRLTGFCRTETYQNTDLRHGPTCFPTQVCQWPTPGVSRHPFPALPACAVGIVVLPGERVCAQRVPGPGTRGLPVSEGARPAPFGRKIPVLVRCQFVPRR